MSPSKSKREILKAQIIELVKEFVKKEGGITGYDIQALFGPVSLYNEIATELGNVPIIFLWDRA